MLPNNASRISVIAAAVLLAFSLLPAVEAVAISLNSQKITLQPEVIPARMMEVAQRLTMVGSAVTDLVQVQGQARAQAQEREPEVTAAEEPNGWWRHNHCKREYCAG